MTGPEKEIDIAALALTLFGEFSKLQEAVDGLAAFYTDRKAAGLKRHLHDQGALKRIPDRHRARLVLDIAANLGTDVDLTLFTDVFHRVKRVRDGIAHAVHTERVDCETLRLAKGYWTTFGATSDEPLTVSRPELKTRLHEARWLLQHIHYIVGSGGLSTRQYLGSTSSALWCNSACCPRISPELFPEPRRRPRCGTATTRPDSPTRTPR